MRPTQGTRRRGAEQVWIVALGALAIAAASTGCNGEETSTATVSAALTVPLPAASTYAVMATRSASFAVRSQLIGGHVAVAQQATPGTLFVDMDARIGVGRVLLAQSVTIRDRAVVGEIGGNTLNIAATATTGPRSAFVAPPPAPTPVAVTVNNTAVTVNVGQTQTRAAGRYGAWTINGTLNLSGGLYEVQSIRLGPDARLVAQARSTVRVQTGVSAADRADIVPRAGLSAADMRLVINGSIDGPTNSLVFNTDGLMTALVVARNAFRAGDRFVGTGAIAARDVFLGIDGRLTFAVGFGCGTNAECDDGNTCTTDACVDAACTTANAPNGTACTDGDACTQTDTCQAGACEGGSAVVCTAQDQCHVAGVCDPASGTCSSPTAPDGTPCTDGDACTDADACQGGTCGGSPLVTEYPTGLIGPAEISTGADGNLWFISPETALGAADGAFAKLSPATGLVTPYPTGRSMVDLVYGPDANIWVSERLSQSGLVIPSIRQFNTAGSPMLDLVGFGADSLTVGPDGDVWFGVTNVLEDEPEPLVFNLVGSLDAPSGALAGDLLFVSNPVRHLAAGPDGNVWLTEGRGSAGTSALIGRVTPSRVLTEFPVLPTSDLNVITAGPDGALWFADAGANAIGRIDAASGAITTFPLPTPSAEPYGITLGPDGNLWFTERSANRLGRITPAGAITELACIPTGESGVSSITTGPDGKLWFTESTAGKIASLRLP